ncbi:MAG: bifunctional diaminohydroxyphosphoribosylaminopyrimidine deaminase/5-amino-6-(5-phosphoribosylamino)uracil reductase RibD [Vulcanimicrobiaceae bacterium]
MDFLQRAVTLAKRGNGNTFPNPIVGAVLVKDDVVIGEGFHAYAGSLHAEAAALRETADARGSTLFVTLEPCAHVGRRPPCTQAILAAGVRRVVVGAMDPDPRTAGRGVAQLRAAGVDVDVRNDPRCERLIEDFRVWVSGDRPYVALKMASSIDGYVAASPATTQRLTGAAWFRRLQHLRYSFQAVMVGAGTALVDDPLLTVRRGSRHVPFARILIGGRRRLAPTLRVFSPLPGYRRTILVVADDGAPWVRELEGVSDIVLAPGERGDVDLKGALSFMREHMAIHSILCEGGPNLAASLLDVGLVDRFFWVVAPALLASPTSVPAVSRIDGNANRAAWKFDSVKKIGDDVLISGSAVRCLAD